MSSLIDETAFKKHIAAGINEGLRGAAEPLIKAALAEIEAELRKHLAAMLLGLVENEYDFERHGQNLRITVNLQGRALK